jgi:predicted amidophosphoribosyltransferase
MPVFTTLPFTASCAGCNEPGTTLCRRCRFSLASAATQVSTDGVLAALPFDGVARQVLHGLKYRNRRGVAHQLARLMVRRLHLGEVDVVTWAPTSAPRARARGYDQSELLARAVARELGVPCRRLLYRSHGEPQTGHTRAERLHGVSFRSRTLSRFGRQAQRRPSRVLLIDDVVTTGATLVAARAALLVAGFVSVVCAAAAATPMARASVAPTTPRALARAS